MQALFIIRAACHPVMKIFASPNRKQCLEQTREKDRKVEKRVEERATEEGRKHSRRRIIEFTDYRTLTLYKELFEYFFTRTLCGRHLIILSECEN